MPLHGSTGVDALTRRLGLILPATAAVGQITAVALMVWCGIYALQLRFSFDPSPTTSFRSHVSSQMLPPLVAAALILGVGLLGAGWAGPGLSRRVIKLLGALVSAALATLVLVHGWRQVHPSFDQQRAAVGVFRPPAAATAQYEVTEAADPRIFLKAWYVPGQPATVCPAARRSLAAWADDGLVEPVHDDALDCAYRGRKGADVVALHGSYFLGINQTLISLTLSRPA
ncbi:hypothetical protein M6D93_12000 [Jatrophihabitans telluris]|uniref:DUF1109 domain-containing protein n=1 Tax=Jatrophihabitans telluris TaxID=2038343 RepID=A0ABY4QUR3_9ACTN|nr:hypothetical protein [Jatrophihabitans telluris]UQX87029.1 hypothetical protein M6D93_12000 [Jatrophihabitans telluris]